MQLVRRPGPSVRVRVKEWVDATTRQREDRLASEEPLEVRLAWPGRPAERVGITMRTPGHDFELATGLLHAQGVVVSGRLHEGHLHRSNLDTVAYCTDVSLPPEQEFNVVTVTLDGPPPELPSSRSDPDSPVSSACGVCGTDSIDAVLHLAGARPAPSTAGSGAPLSPTISAELLTSLPRRLREQQRIFASTGGLHAAAIVDGDGRFVQVREDIGRHNAVDKVIGAQVLAGHSPTAPLMVVSGRIGFELVQKCVVAGIGALVAIGAPSSLAVRMAEESGVGLVGFLSAKRFVIYSGSDRFGV